MPDGTPAPHSQARKPRRVVNGDGDEEDLSMYVLWDFLFSQESSRQNLRSAIDISLLGMMADDLQLLQNLLSTDSDDDNGDSD